MQIIIIVLAVILGVILLGLLLGWFWIRNKIQTFAEAVEQILEGTGGGVPPFRIHLQRSPDVTWRKATAIESISAELAQLGYSPVGDFAVPETEGLLLRGFWHPQVMSYAALYDHPEVGVFTDFYLSLHDKEKTIHLSVSNSPESGMDRPEWAPLIRVEVDLEQEPSAVQRLHQRLVEAQADRQVDPASAAEFESKFIQAYADEMDWRIQRGGVTEEEVRRVAALHQQDPPDQATVEMIQEMWRNAITEFVTTQIREAFLTKTSMSAAEWEAKRDRVLVVHDHVDLEILINQLCWEMIPEDLDEDAEERALRDAHHRISSAFKNLSIRQGFAEIQRLLPASKRYEWLGQVDSPWPADLYLEPDSESVDLAKLS